MSSSDESAAPAGKAEEHFGQRFEIDPRLKPEAISAVFRRFGRVHIPGVLEKSSALGTYAALSARLPWQMHFNDGDQVFDLPADQFDELPVNERGALLRDIHFRARLGFQYLYDSFAISDHHARGEHRDLVLMRVFEFLRSESVLEFARRATGIREIRSVDAQATRYRTGHFLTAHDDFDDVKGRVAAYVLNLTPGWRTDWGGILQFIAEDGHVAEGYMPTFNAMNLFRVPLLHSVSPVAPFAGTSRLSITGWFRR